MNEVVADRGKVWKWLAVAAALALVLLFVVVLPAEYGYDPTRLGSALGLTEMSDKRKAGGEGLVVEDILSANDSLATATGSDLDTPIPLPNPAISQIEAAPPKTETMRIQLDFDERTEVKVEMAKSKVVLYSWKVTGGDVYVDFHGHDPAKGNSFWVRYEEAGQEEGQGVSSRNGSLVAPFDGQHGWYFLNLAQGPITIDLTVTGYFDRLVDLRLTQK
ncbi:MAG: hypothetical protein M3Y79_05955 [Pseudomonadota bacterium]|nr:hypothetical protein [Pseudomonadota bacterium]